MLIVQLCDLNYATIDVSRLSPQILVEADRLTGARKKQFLICRAMLANLLHQFFHLPELPDIVIGDNSRPAFAKKNLPDFNISHSENMVAVAIAEKDRVGLDIELSRPRKNHLSIARHFYSDVENEWLNRQNNKLDAFWALWTLKESALKLYAKGVWQMKSLSFNLDTNAVTAPFGDQFHFQYHKLGEVHLSVNSAQPITDLTLLTQERRCDIHAKSQTAY